MTIILTNTRIIDGNGESSEDQFVVIENTKIKEIGNSKKLPTSLSAQQFNLSGHSILPGIIDCHVHFCIDSGSNPGEQVARDSDTMLTLRMAKNAKKTLGAGVTTVRDEGAKNHIDFSFRSAVNEGLCSSPRLILSGQPICMTGGHGWQIGREADGPNEVRRAAREQIKAGADSVKMIATGGIVTKGTEISSPQLSEEELRAGVQEAKKAGKLTSAHAQGTEGIKNAIRAGISSVEHAYFLDDEGIDLMLKHDTFLIPTSAAVKIVVEKGTEAGIPDWAVRKASSALDSHIKSFKKARAAGVKMAMGTDAGMPYNFHGDNLQELHAMVELGLTPMEAIIMATKHSAEFLGLGKIIGTVEAGKEADLLVVEGNPLDDISVLTNHKKIAYVIKGGQIVVQNHFEN
jgi:imidazolonepropionase-like amidohydrolase